MVSRRDNLSTGTVPIDEIDASGKYKFKWTWLKGRDSNRGFRLDYIQAENHSITWFIVSITARRLDCSTKKGKESLSRIA